MMGRPIWLHFASGADPSTTRLMYFAIGDEVYPDMYAISTNKWEHDSSDKSNLSLLLFNLKKNNIASQL